MVVRVYERGCDSGADSVQVATDDERIVNAVEQAGGRALMTRSDHASGTDRLQEVATQLGLNDDDILVNVQGDEPLIPPAVIDQVADNLAARPDFAMATLCEPISEAADLHNPNIVKLVADSEGRALYFSRAPLPWRRDGMPQTGGLEAGDWWRHIGIYAYRVGFLHRFVGWPQGQLEALESLEQLRALENGAAIHVAEAVAEVPGGVDTPEDLARIQQQFT